LFDGKFDSGGRILWIGREQQDVQSFADGNLQCELFLSNEYDDDDDVN